MVKQQTNNTNINIDEDIIEQNNNILLIGYSQTTRQRLFLISVISISVSIVCLFIFQHISFIPFLATLASLTGEMWWKSRKSLILRDNALFYGDEKIEWSDITRYTKWDSFSIPFVPWKLDGVTVYYKNTCFCVYSRAVGYDIFLRRLESLSFTTTSTVQWFQYSPRLMRIFRYALAFFLSVAFFLVLSLSLIIILALVIAVYFLVRSFVQSKRNTTKNIPQDAWIAGAGSLLLFCLLYYIFQSPYLIFVITIIPISIILWYPWQPKKIAIAEEALFVGKQAAYPLRHLRTSRIISRFFLFKVWSLSFANGDVRILPCLENFNFLKLKLERQWADIQLRYQKKAMNASEAEIRTPQEEARRLHIFEADKISFNYPLSWYFLYPFLFLLNILLLAMIIACVYYSSLGRISLLGLLLREITPAFLLVYVCYIVLSILPRVLRLCHYYSINEQGIFINNTHVSWDELKLFVPYTDAEQCKRIAIFNSQGKKLLELHQEMSDWQYIWDKIQEHIKKNQIAKEEDSGSVTLLTQRSLAWHKSTRLVIALIILAILPFRIQSIVNSKQILTDNAMQAVTLPHTTIPFLGLTIVPYQDYTGKTWYALACPRDKETQLYYQNIKIQYIPDHPIYAMPYGDVQDPFISLLNYIESKGFNTEHLNWIEQLIFNARYVFWGLSAILILFALLHRNFFAGLLLQKMPSPLGSKISMPAPLILEKTLQLLLHIALLSGLFILLFYLYIGYMIVPIPMFNLILCILLPIFLMPYLAYVFLSIIPELVRSFRHWKIDEDSISQGKTKLYWNQIKNIFVFSLPYKKTRKVAWIQSYNNQSIFLDGNLIHFSLIIDHIKKQSKCTQEKPKNLGRIYRKAYSLPKLVRCIMCLLIIALLILFYNNTMNLKESSIFQGTIQHAHVEYTFFHKIAILSYNDQYNHKLYTLAWQHTNKRDIDILYNSSNPYFWESLDNSVSSIRTLLYNVSPKFFNFIEPHTKYIEQALLGIMAFLACIILLLLLKHLVGVLFGFPSFKEK